MRLTLNLLKFDRFTCFFRVIWGLIIFGGLVLFTYLLSGKIMMLINKDKQVDYEVAFLNQLRFPAVTICNENRYRLTHPLYK